jgi:carotenoid cleavage dioxygenase-like enzyme
MGTAGGHESAVGTEGCWCKIPGVFASGLASIIRFLETYFSSAAAGQIARRSSGLMTKLCASARTADLAQGGGSRFTLPASDGFSEPVFVPRGEDAAEGDGWLIATVWRAAERRSEHRRAAHGPVATVRLPHRVPAGFHGNWVANAA